jgi:hypothetical protein
LYWLHFLCVPVPGACYAIHHGNEVVPNHVQQCISRHQRRLLCHTVFYLSHKGCGLWRFKTRNQVLVCFRGWNVSIAGNYVCWDRRSHWLRWM